MGKVSTRLPLFFVLTLLPKPGAGGRPTAMVSIGELIKQELQRQERTVSWLARKLSCDRSNIYRLFQKHSIDTALLQRISIILNKDFFAELSKDMLNKDDV